MLLAEITAERLEYRDAPLPLHKYAKQPFALPEDDRLWLMGELRDTIHGKSSAEFDHACCVIAEHREQLMANDPSRVRTLEQVLASVTKGQMQGARATSRQRLADHRAAPSTSRDAYGALDALRQRLTR